MPTLESWKILRDGGADEVVLGVDFTVTGRPEASFSDLVPKLDGGVTFWESLPPPVNLGADMNGDEYIDRWLGEVRASGRTVRTVMGYCVGSVFASVMLDRISQWQARPPQVICFDPESPVLASLYRDFVSAVHMLASILTSDEVAEATQAGAAAMEEGGDDFGTVGSALSKIFKEAANIAFDRVGLDPELREELTGTFGAFVSYLIAARQVDPLPGLARATAITSALSSSGASLAAREIRFDMDHVDVLRDDRVAAAVRELMAEYA